APGGDPRGELEEEVVDPVDLGAAAGDLAPARARGRPQPVGAERLVAERREALAELRAVELVHERCERDLGGLAVRGSRELAQRHRLGAAHVAEDLREAVAQPRIAERAAPARERDERLEGAAPARPA